MGYSMAITNMYSHYLSIYYTNMGDLKMHFTKYIKYDGYCESICHLKEGLGPVLRCRIVNCSDGNHEIVIRDFKTGKMVSSRRWKRSLETNKEMAKQQAIAFVRSATGAWIVNGGS